MPPREGPVRMSEGSDAKVSVEKHRDPEIKATYTEKTP